MSANGLAYPGSSKREIGYAHMSANVSVRGGRDEDLVVAPTQASAHEVGDPVVKERFLLVVLNQVPIAQGRRRTAYRHGLRSAKVVPLPICSRMVALQMAPARRNEDRG